MSRTGIIFGAIVIFAVLWFIISKAQNALDTGVKTIQTQTSGTTVSPEDQAKDIVNTINQEGQ